MKKCNAHLNESKVKVQSVSQLKPTRFKRWHFHLEGECSLFLVCIEPFTVTLLYLLVDSWQVFADKLASCIQTTGDCSNLLAIKVIFSHF